MKLRILHKVFLALFVTAGLSLGAMMLLVQWSLGRGFLDYVNSVEQESAEQFAAVLAEEYTARGNHWNWVTSGRTWQKMTRPKGKQRRGGGPRSRDDRPPSPRRSERQNDGPRENHTRPKREDRPPPPDPRSGRPPLHAGARMSLFDAQKNYIIGRDRVLSSKLHLQEITVDGQSIGWLTLKPLKKVSGSRDSSFLQSQSRELLLIAGLLLLASAILAVLLAGHVTRPLQAITGVVKQLVGGRYDSRVNTHGHDEISTLANDIDTLANTLEDNQQTRQRWIADISHELRTPVAILRAELEALKEGVRPSTPDAIDSIHTEILHLNKLIDDLHEVSLSDIGELSCQMADVDVGEILDMVVAQFARRFEEKNIALDHEPGTQQRWRIQGDTQRLLQLFTNLLENSLRYTDSGGTLKIRLDRHQHQAVLTFADTAPGVTADDCSRLFDRLYRADKSRSRANGGSGLGLAICKSIVAAHGGEIMASEAETGGLKITLHLPLAE